MGTMIDLTSRPNRDTWTDGAEPTDVNGLVQARIDGRLGRREFIRRATALGLAAPVVGVLLHASSDLAFGAPGPRTRNPGAPRQETVPAEGPTEPDGEPQTGGTVVAGVTEEPSTLHPWLAPATSVADDVARGVMQGLLHYDSSQQLLPALAEGFELSSDALTYTFRLRQGVTWHNGEPFSVDDLIASWQMIMDPAFAEMAQPPGEVLSQLGWDKIVDISGDGGDAVITTSEPFAPFLSYVAGSTVLCPASELAKGPQAFKDAFSRNLIGTGPLTFVEWVPGERIELARFDAYWGNAAKLDGVVVRFLPDEAAQIERLQAGEIQLAAGAGAFTAAHVDSVLALDDVVVLEHPTLAWTHLDLKQIDFLRETKVRQALDFATPSAEIIEQVLNGRAIQSVADQAPSTPFHNPNIQPRPYDLDQARALLDESGLDLGEDGIRIRDGKRFEMQLWGVAGSAQGEQICRLIAERWNQIGVKTETFFEEQETLWGPMGYQFTEKMTACLYAWINANDPDDMFYWHSSQIPTCPVCDGGNLPAYFFPYNFQPEIDDLTERAARETDVEQRKELYFQIQELLHEEVPVIFLYWGKDFPVVARALGGVWPSAYTRLLWNVEDWYLTA